MLQMYAQPSTVNMNEPEDDQLLVKTWTRVTRWWPNIDEDGTAFLLQ